jgi:RNA polymerase sigma-70 factor (ECF subfamily)
LIEKAMPGADSGLTRPSLLLRIRDAADSDSWSEFADVYGPLVRAYCRRWGLQDADARDVEQEVLAQVSRSIAAFEYEPARGRFRDWLGTVTRRKIARLLERSKDRRGTGGDDANARLAALEASGTDPEWTSDFHARILETAFARVRPCFEASTWDAFARVWADGQPAARVADETGLSIDSVYAAKSRVLKRLREEVLSLAEDLPLSLPTP